jgi:hypothetical protein
MLVNEGVAGAFIKREIHGAAGVAIIGGEALGELDRGPLILRALKHQSRRQINLLAALDDQSRRRFDLRGFAAEEDVVALGERLVALGLGELVTLERKQHAPA